MFMESGTTALFIMKKFKSFMKQLRATRAINAIILQDWTLTDAYWKYHFNHNPEDCCNLRK